MHSGIKCAFDFLDTLDVFNLEPVKMKIDGDRIYMNVTEMPVKSIDQGKLEIHKQYIDIQIPISGDEVMGWKSKDDLQFPVGDFDIVKDYQLFDDKPENLIHVKAGEFVIFFPSDGHQPGISSIEHRKIIIKILV
jgi:YhcH/YjgK/YiaL family protein